MGGTRRRGGRGKGHEFANTTINELHHKCTISNILCLRRNKNVKKQSMAIATTLSGIPDKVCLLMPNVGSSLAETRGESFSFETPGTPASASSTTRSSDG